MGAYWDVDRSAETGRPLQLNPAPLNLPSERLVLALGVGIAAAAYVYWTVQGLRLGVGWTDVAALRAAIPLGATLLLALILRAVRSLHDRRP